MVGLREKGFTLAEILIAIAILGIVTASGFTAYTISLQKSRDATRKKSVQSLQQALEAYMNDYGVYPLGDDDGKIVACGDGTVSCDWGDPMSVSGRIYIQQLPVEVRAGYTYFYRTDTARSKYQIYAHLENPNDPAIPDAGEYTVDCGDANCNFGMASANAGAEDSL